MVVHFVAHLRPYLFQLLHLQDLFLIMAVDDIERICQARLFLVLLGDPVLRCLQLYLEFLGFRKHIEL